VAVAAGALLLGAFGTEAAIDLGGGFSLQVLTLAPEVVQQLPPLPPTSTFPVQLVLDDDVAEGSVGVSNMQGAQQFLYLNRFTPGVAFELEEVWVLFPVTPNVAVGGAVQIAIYDDADSDPSNGASLLASFDTTIQVVDGVTFSVYPLGAPVTIAAGSDVLIGVVPRFIVSGGAPTTSPAAIDSTTSQMRSWIGVWSGDPPDPPVLVPVPDSLFAPVDGFVPGNWMIRGFGTPLVPPVNPLEIPTAPGGLALLGVLLALAGAWLLARPR
jgi:hypothetical protein